MSVSVVTYTTLLGALGSANKAGKPLHLTAGKYYVDGPLLTTVPIRGDWSRTTTLLLRGATARLIVGQSEQIHLRDFSIEGNGSGDQIGIQVGGIGMQADFCYLSGLEVRRCGGDGVRFVRGNCGSIRDSHFFANGGNGINLDSPDGCSNAHTIHAYCVSNTLNGLRIGWSSANVIDVTAEGNSGWGLEITNPQRIVTCYTEGNVLGGLKCTEGCYGAIINCWSWEGWQDKPGNPPLVLNRNNLAIWGQTQKAPWET
jgi:hypothetical protein